MVTISACFLVTLVTCLALHAMLLEKEPTLLDLSLVLPVIAGGVVVAVVAMYLAAFQRDALHLAVYI
jgi:hypothetical protein